MSATVVIIGTCDTKLEQLAFLRRQIVAAPGSLTTCLIDVGRHPSSNPDIDVHGSDMLAKYRPELDISTLSRGDFIDAMGSCAMHAVLDMLREGKLDGIVSAGGSCGTSLCSRVMRSLPIGLPKLVISTVASGDTGPIVGETDITLMYSVVDIAGMNPLLRDILSNAGAAIAAAAVSYSTRRRSRAQPSMQQTPAKNKKRVGITMFGVTTPGVDAIREAFEARYPVETYVFHATGHGGKAMERLIAEGQLDAVIDLTTTEVCDHIMGGVMSAGAERLNAAVQAAIPTIVSLGALDMANFGAKHSVPERYAHRAQVEHNSLVTVVRSSPEDARAIGQFICDKLRSAANPALIQMWLPLGGISLFSVPGGPFYDADADAVLFDTIREGLRKTGIRIIEDAGSVNDGAFAARIVAAMAELMGL
ncbi:hypothetical protein E4U57_004163 [Claviceps arundinis]|uniref:Uncharacterized protein n=1 Tax=Claviceps arundinis TaxID=1623583 RepID=A0ABQ7P5I9_9HYPO|nr:hypothetical protein E4U57_004163 [Claviceps arundinis]